MHAVLQRIKALMNREFTLIKRTFVIYKAKTVQVIVTALVAATLFLRTHIHPVSPQDGQEIAGYCFFATLVMLFNGIAELSQSVSHALNETVRLVEFRCQDVTSRSTYLFSIHIPCRVAPLAVAVG